MSKVSNITAFGLYVRKLRLEKGILLKDMAKDLDVSASYLSRIERGGRNVPFRWCDLISKHYYLNKKETKALERAIVDSRTYNQLDISHLSYEDNLLIHRLVRQTYEMGNDKREKMVQMVNYLEM